MFNFAQAQDSLKIYFVGAGYKGESFKVKVYENDDFYEIKLRDIFLDSLSISTLNKVEGDALSLHILRKPKYSFFYRKLLPVIPYRKGYKYLFLNRDFNRKNKYAFEYIYSNEYLDSLEVRMY